MKKIIVIGDRLGLNDLQKERLEKLGQVSYLPTPDSSENWVSSVKDVDIICTDGAYLFENLENLEDVFIVYPYIELGSFDSKKLAEKNVYIANTKGSNKNSIVEWVMFSMLSLFRKFIPTVNTKASIPLEFTDSLENKNVLVIGKGDIGMQIGKACEAFHMNVDFFSRGDNLIEKVKDADVIVNALNSNTTNENLLDENFFMSLKEGSYYVSFVRQHTFDLNALILALDKGILAGAAIDCDPEKPGDVSNDFYQKILSSEKILATPHIAFSTKQAKENGTEFLIQNVEKYIEGKCENIIEK